MKRILLSILLAIVAMGANAQFKGSVDARYHLDPESYAIQFNFARVCAQLGVDKEDFGKLLITQWGRPASGEHDYSLYLLTDGGGGAVSNYQLTQDGRKATNYGERKWRCDISPYSIEFNQFLFMVQAYADDEGEPLLNIGDVCHAVFALEYKGRIATFDITMNITKEDGPAIPLSSLEKVGEQMFTGTYDYATDKQLDFSTEGITALFGDDVEPLNLELYGMRDAEKELIIRGGGRLKIDGTPNLDRRSREFYSLRYDMNGIHVSAESDIFKGGQKTSGSVFLVADGKYYELILDIQFGDEYADQESFDIVKTEQMDVQLVYTEQYFTYRNREDGRYGLISTDIDEAAAKALIGTDSPKLFAEQKKDNVYNFTSRYNAAPGQGFWFVSDEEGQLYRQPTYNKSIGVYYTEGSLKWYEDPYMVELGNKYKLNLYLANPENGKAVKYEINVELVKELQTKNVAYVRKLPIGMEDANSIQSTPISQPSSSALYDLSGRKLQQKPTKGIYIKGQKKVLVK